MKTSLGPSHEAWISDWWRNFLINNDGERKEADIRAEWKALCEAHEPGYEMIDDTAEADAVIPFMGVEVASAVLSLDARAAALSIDSLVAAAGVDTIDAAAGASVAGASTTLSSVEVSPLARSPDPVGGASAAAGAAAAADVGGAPSAAASGPPGRRPPAAAKRRVWALFNRLWKSREKWMGFFTALSLNKGLHTSGRNESQHGVWKEALPPKLRMLLSDYIPKFNALLEQRDEEVDLHSARADARAPLQCLCHPRLVGDARAKVTPYAARLIEEAAYGYGLTYKAGDLEPDGARQKRVVVRRVHGKGRLEYPNPRESDMVVEAEFVCDARVVRSIYGDDACSKVIGMTCSCRRYIWQELPCAHELYVLIFVLQEGDSLPDYLLPSDMWRREQAGAAAASAAAAAAVLPAVVSRAAPPPHGGTAVGNRVSEVRAFASPMHLVPCGADFI